MATKYEELASELRRRIEEGEYPPGSTLPGYAEIMATYSASQATVRAALEMLQSEGLVRAVKRLGIVVREPGERRRIQRGTLITRDPQRGYIFPAASSPGEPWQTHGRPRASMEPAPGAVAAALGIQAGSETVRRRRVTSPVDEPPFQLVDTWIHPDVLAEAPQAGEADTGPGGYLDRIEESGHGPLSWNEVTRARMATREEAKLLEISASMPVLEMATTGISAKTGQPVEVSVRVIPSDRAEIVSRLQRAASARWPVEPVRSAEK